MIAHAFKLATSSIYNWLDSGRIAFSCNNLPHRNIYKCRKAEQRGTFKVHQSIEIRPDYINNRTDFGHWEVDTVLSSRGQDKACLVTFVERQSRLLWAIKAPNRTAMPLHNAFTKFIDTFKGAVKTITVDHGKEFAQYRALEQDFQLKIYFCHAYSLWKRGTNDNFNRRLRWFFSKKTNFSKVSEDQIYEALELINNRPLKINQWRTSIERFKLCSN